MILGCVDEEIVTQEYKLWQSTPFSPNIQLLNATNENKGYVNPKAFQSRLPKIFTSQ